MGASSLRRLGWLMKIWREATDSCLISDSLSCTNLPGLEDRTSISLSIILSKTAGSISPSFPTSLHTHTQAWVCAAFRDFEAFPICCREHILNWFELISVYLYRCTRQLIYWVWQFKSEAHHFLLFYTLPLVLLYIFFIIHIL